VKKSWTDDGVRGAWQGDPPRVLLAPVLLDLAATYLWGTWFKEWSGAGLPDGVATTSPTLGQEGLDHADHPRVVGADVPLSFPRGRRSPRLISVHGDGAPVT
jgi:hypothetical protein